MNDRGFVIGIDGGGTKTVGRLADLQGTAMATLATGPTNPNVTGMDASARALCDLIRALCANASCRVGDLRGIVMGLAGAAGTDVQQQIHEHVTQCLHEGSVPDPQIQVVTDIRIALEGAFGGGPGVAVVAGTGSSVMYKTAHGDVDLVGGWGRILGDEGSGYSIGLEAFKAVARAFDGREPSAGSLRQALASQHGLDSRARIIAAVYREGFPIPSVAPLVLELAARGDGASCRILKQAAAQLAETVGAALARMGDGPVGVVLSGGLVEKENSYREMLVAELTARYGHVRIQSPQFSPEQGAVLMALSAKRKVPRS